MLAQWQSGVKVKQFVAVVGVKGIEQEGHGSLEIAAIQLDAHDFYFLEEWLKDSGESGVELRDRLTTPHYFFFSTQHRQLLPAGVKHLLT